MDSPTNQSGDKAEAPPQDATVEQRLAALLEIEGNLDADPSTIPEEAEVTENDDSVADDSTDSEEQDAEEGDESTESDEGSDAEEGAEEEEFVFTVVVDGEKAEVSADELVAGYQRQQDYSRKTAKLAEERKGFDSERQEVQQERAKYASLLDRLETALQSTLPAEPDWQKLRQENPQEYAVRRAEYQEQKEKLAAIQAERESVRTKQQQDMLREMQKRVEEERVKLVEAVPEWTDPEKLSEGTRSLQSYATSLGFSDEDLAAVTDHRVVLLLRKAMMYDKLQGQKPVVRKRAKGAPTIKPGAKQPTKPRADASKSAREQLKKSGSVQDAAGAFFAMLGSE